MLKIVYLDLNHSNNVCKSILLSNLCCLQSTFASNYRYLSSKYNISLNDWFTNVIHLICKVGIKFQQNSRSSNEVQSLIELCAIRNGLYIIVFCITSMFTVFFLVKLIMLLLVVLLYYRNVSISANKEFIIIMLIHKETLINLCYLITMSSDY